MYKRAESFTRESQSVAFGDRQIHTPVGQNLNPINSERPSSQPRLSVTQKENKMKLVRRQDGSRTAIPPLAPLKQGDEKPKFTNLAERFVKHDELQQEDLTKQTRLQMKLINDEMRDILLMAKDTKTAIREMNEAFKGDQEIEYVATKHKNKTKVSKRKKTVDPRQALTAPLQPVYEVDDSRALVQFENPKQKKKQRQNLKERAKQITGELGQNPFIFGKESTFVTGGGLAVRQPKPDNESSDSFENNEADEDRLLREVEQHEKDFNEMLQYLNDVDEMLHGSELQEIKKMKEISSLRMKDHMAAYEQIQREMGELADEAIEVMNSSAYDKQAKKIGKLAAKQNQEYKTELAVIHEKKEQTDSLRLGAQAVVGTSLEAQKKEIVASLQSMHNNMKDYTKDVESRLERAMQTVGSKDVARKLGFEQIGAKNLEEFMTDDRNLQEYKDTQAFNRKLVKLATHAQDYVQSLPKIDKKSNQ